MKNKYYWRLKVIKNFKLYDVTDKYAWYGVF